MKDDRRETPETPSVPRRENPEQNMPNRGTGKETR